MVSRISKGSSGYRAAIVAAFTGITMLAAAQAPAVALGVSVKYTNQDLQTTAGVERLYERIREAAAQVCPAVSSLELQRHAAAMRCQEAAIAQAVTSIGSPQLAAVYAAKSHHGTPTAA